MRGLPVRSHVPAILQSTLRACAKGPRMSRWTLFLLVVSGILGWLQPAFGQAGFDDPRVMLQGFYWESYRHGHPDKPEWDNFGDKRWYEIIKDKADELRDAKIDLVWLPPP